MKKIFLILISLLMINASFAQKSDKEAIKLLDKVKKTYTKSAISLKFTHELKNAKANISQSESGKAIINKQKYNITLEKAKINQIYDGNKVFTISHDEKEISVSKPEDDSDLMTPTKILDNFKKDYIITFSGKKTVKGKNCTLIKLIPTQKTSKIKDVEVAIETATSQLVQLIEENIEGTETTLIVTEFTKNLVAPGALFKVNLKSYKNKGYIVTEL